MSSSRLQSHPDPAGTTPAQFADTGQVEPTPRLVSRIGSTLLVASILGFLGFALAGQGLLALLCLATAGGTVATLLLKHKGNISDVRAAVRDAGYGDKKGCRL